MRESATSFSVQTEEPFSILHSKLSRLLARELNAAALRDASPVRIRRNAGNNFWSFRPSKPLCRRIARNCFMRSIELSPNRRRFMFN